MKEYLLQNNVEIEERNISDGKHRIDLMRMGYRGIPVTIIDDEAVVGFDKVTLDDMLDM